MSLNNSIWDVSHSLVNNDNSFSMKWLDAVKDEVSAEKAAGFPLSSSDYLGHAMAYDIIPQLPHDAANYTVSDIKN